MAAIARACQQDGRVISGASFVVPEALFPEAWREYVARAIAAEIRNANRQDVMARLTVRGALGAGWLSPAEVPSDPHVLFQRLRDTGVRAEEASLARAHLRDMHLKAPEVAPVAIAPTRSAGSVLHVESVAELDRERALRALSPRIMQEIDTYMRLANAPAGGAAPLSPSMRRNVAYSVERIVHAFAKGAGAGARHFQTGEPLPPLEELRLRDLVWYDVVEAGRLGDQEAAVLALLDDEERQEQTEAIPVPGLWPLLRDGFAAIGLAPRTAQHALTHVVDVLTTLYGSIRQPADREARFAHVVNTKAAAREFEHVQRQLNPAHLLERIQWHELVAFWLPELAQRVRDQRAAWSRAMAKARGAGHETPEAHPAVLRAYREYAGLSERYLALAIPVAMPVRRANFTYGELGLESSEGAAWRLRVEGSVERPTGIGGFSANLTSQPKTGDARAKLKYQRKKKREKNLEQHVSPAIVAFDVLFDYLRDVRAPELAQAGLLVDGDPLGVTIGQSLLLGRDGKAPDQNHWNKRYQQSLLEGIAWLRPELPTLVDEAERGVFSLHRVRTLFATFWFGIVADARDGGLVMSGREIAQHYTTDTATTLAKNYVAVSAAMNVAVQREGDAAWANPRRFIAVMSRALSATQPINWSTVDMPRP
ncbi:MAG: hypothetical protein MUF00_21320, partial [Gemmatimonadaceae bacterium]|nr:hypothetical protein [Gemmatimonadaceae bacterium]